MTDFFFRRNDIFPVDTAVGAYDGLDVIAPEGRPPPAGLVDTATMTSEGLTFTGLAESGRYWAVAEVDTDEYRWMGFWTAPSQEIAVGPEGPDGPQGPAGLDEGMVFNVKNPDYGAVGDGSTDDTGAINNALAAAAAVNGTVFCPPGTYVISQLGIPSDTRLVGSGPGKTIFEANSASVPIINLDFTNGNHDIEVRDFSVDGGTVVEDFVMRFGNYPFTTRDATTDITVSNVEIYGGAPGSEGLLQLTNVARGRVLDCYLHDSSRDGLQWGNGYDCIVRGCRIFDTQDDCIAFTGADAVMERCSAIGNTVGDLSSGAGHSGIGLSAVHGGVVSGNVIRGCQAGILASNYNALTSEDISITGNTLERPGLAQADVDAGGGIHIVAGQTSGGTADAGVSGVSVVGNSMRSPNSFGIAVVANDNEVASKVTIANNTIDFDAGEAETFARGIFCFSTSAGAEIRDVTISGNEVSNAPGDGILLFTNTGSVGDLERVSVIGNTVRDSGGNGVQIYSTDSGGVDTVLVSSNRCTDTRTGGSKTQDYGLFVYQSSNVSGNGNDFRGNATAETNYPLGGNINVKDYGATGDGSTDDTVAIQAAIDACGAAGGGAVYFPAGTYLCNGSFSAGGQYTALTVINDNVSLVGAGRDATELVTTEDQGLIWFGGPGKPDGFVNWADYAIWDTSATTIYDLTGTVDQYSRTVTCVTAAHAGNFAAGDIIYIRTGQTVGPSFVNEPDAELNEVLSVNAGTGVITLKYPTAKSYEQENFISGSAGPSEPGGAGTACPFGVANVTDRVLRNIGFSDMSLTANDVVTVGGRNVLLGTAVWGWTIERCRVTCSIPVNGQREFRQFRSADNEYDMTVAGDTSMWSTGLASGCSDCVFEGDVMQGTLHVHEGAADVRVSNCTIRANCTTNGAVSIRGRAYDQIYTNNVIVNTGGNGIYIDEACTGGGVVQGNRISGGGGDPVSIFLRNGNWRENGNYLTGRSIIYGIETDTPVGNLDQSPQLETWTYAAWLTDDKQTAELGYYQAHGVVTDVRVYCYEAFNSSGTDQVTVGFDGNATAFTGTLDVSTTGVKTSVGAYVGYPDDVAHTIKAYYTNGGTEPTTGAVFVEVDFHRIVARPG